jgi:endo-beta-N-acetylglucosaminidase D
LIGRFHYEGFIGTYCSEEQIKSKRQIMIEIIEQAKEMEKEQIKNAWYNSLTKGDYNSAEEYYNETYK